MPAFRVIFIIIFCIGGSEWSYNTVIGWITYEISKSELITSFALGVSGLPFLFIGIFAGSIVDRFNRHKLLIVGLSWMLLASIIFSLLALVGKISVPVIYIFAFVNGMGGLIFHIVTQPLITNMVPRSYLVNSFALESFSYHMAQFLIPIAVGALIAWEGPGIALLVPVIFYFIAFMAAWFLKTESSESRMLVEGGSLGLITEGLKYIWNSRSIFPLLVVSIIPVVFVMPTLYGLLPVYAVEVFDVGPTGLGALTSAMGIGAALGAILLAFVGNNDHKGKLIIISILVSVLATFIFALNSVLQVAFPILGVTLGALIIYFSTGTALVQSLAVDEMRGRVAAITAIPIGLFPVGSIIAGSIAEFIGAANTTIVIAVFSLILLVLFTRYYPRVWNLA